MKTLKNCLGYICIKLYPGCNRKVGTFESPKDRLSLFPGIWKPVCEKEFRSREKGDIIKWIKSIIESSTHYSHLITCIKLVRNFQKNLNLKELGYDCFVTLMRESNMLENEIHYKKCQFI